MNGKKLSLTGRRHSQRARTSGSAVMAVGNHHPLDHRKVHRLVQILLKEQNPKFKLESFYKTDKKSNYFYFLPSIETFWLRNLLSKLLKLGRYTFYQLCVFYTFRSCLYYGKYDVSFFSFFYISWVQHFRWHNIQSFRILSKISFLFILTSS